MTKEMSTDVVDVNKALLIVLLTLKNVLFINSMFDFFFYYYFIVPCRKRQFHIDVPQCFILSCSSSLILIVPFCCDCYSGTGVHIRFFFRKKKLKIINI